MIDTIKTLGKLGQWCRVSALPYWASNGLHSQMGSHERLHMDGRPNVNSTLRMRVQARQAYVYAHASSLGWYKNAKQISDHCWRFLTGPGFTRDANDTASCVHLLNPDGRVCDALQDTYDQTFVILAGAWRYKAFNDTSALDVAKQVLKFLDANVKDKTDGWLEGVPAKTPRRQNPHMHMFEALLVLYSTTDDQKYLDQLEALFNMFKNYFFDAQTHTIIEYFDQDWMRSEKNGGPIVPGHMMEWCWLLQKYGEHGSIEAKSYSEKLFFQAIELGVNKKNQLLCDTVDGVGGLQSATFRSWPQTEYIKACLAMARQFNDFTYVKKAAKIIDVVFTTYLKNVPMGGWVDMVDEDGRPVSKYMQASSFYHFLGAAAQADRFVKEHTKFR